MITFTKHELLCIQQCIIQHEAELRKQQLVTIECQHFVEGDFALLDVYYNKRLALIQKNKEKIADALQHIAEAEKPKVVNGLQVIARMNFEFD